MTRGYVSRGTITVEAEVDVGEILHDLDDDDFRAECKRRGILHDPKLDSSQAGAREAFTDLMGDFRQAMIVRDARHFEILILRLEMMIGVPRQAMPEKAFKVSVPA